jgi:hypothetical protein
MVHHKGKPEFSSQTKVLGNQLSCFQTTNFIEGLDTKTFQIPTAAFQKPLPLQGGNVTYGGPSPCYCSYWNGKFRWKKGRILNKNHIIIGVWNGGSHLFNRGLGPGQ